DWRRFEAKVRGLFPQKVGLMVIVVDGTTPEAADEAAEKIYRRLMQDADDFNSVRRPDGLEFFRRNGLLFLSTEELADTSEQIVAAQPLIGALAADPSLRGLFDVLNDALRGIEEGEIKAVDFAGPLAEIAATIDASLAGEARPLSWQGLLTGREANGRELRRFVLAQPKRDYSQLQPGARAVTAVRQAIRDLDIGPEDGVRVRLTGEVPIADEEFATVLGGTTIGILLSMLLVGGLLYMALRSWRLILPILLTLATGLVVTAWFAALAIGSLNVISVTFAVLFIGIGVDFGIQFAVRYRHERFLDSDMSAAIRRAGRGVGPALLLAAMATAVGFFSFMPTDYRGVSELGLISGVGMFIAVALNVTLLPALLALFRPPPEADAVGFAWARPLDRLLRRHRRAVLAVTALAALLCALTLPVVQFDMNPLNLKDQGTEAVSTLRELMADPDTTPYTIDVLAPSLAEADRLAARIGALGEVRRTITLSSFVPKEQDRKLPLVHDLRDLLLPTLMPVSVLPAPDAAAIEEALAAARNRLARVREVEQALPVSFAALEGALARLAGQGRAGIRVVEAPLMGGLPRVLDQLRLALQAERVTLASIPEEVRAPWLAADGQARIEVAPSGDSRDNAVLVEFVAAVRAITPDITGTPVTIQGSANAVKRAFIIAGIGALIAITVLLAVVLRQPLDVALVMAPLLLAGLFTLATTVAIDLDLNFANVIALPLLLGIGVAFSIYFVMNWRHGVVDPLQTGTARAVLFSACTTAAAFGCLAISSHDGTSGMGVLLSIALFYSLFCTLIVLPALLAMLPGKKAA
ncbi:MAG: MMPL family transporter, partial [Alphaproteobacteria bacterium]|nr:MMPL family transporter [Alphaproteobacteria bacterium]